MWRAVNNRYMPNMPSAMTAPWVRLITSITPQIRLRPIAASPYTEPMSRPSIMEARIPDISHPRAAFHSDQAKLRNYSELFSPLLVDRIHQIGALAGQGPDHLLHQRARFVFLPLRQNHGVANLQAVLIRGRGKLRFSVESRDVCS